MKTYTIRVAQFFFVLTFSLLAGIDVFAGEQRSTKLYEGEPRLTLPSNGARQSLSKRSSMLTTIIEEAQQPEGASLGNSVSPSPCNGSREPEAPTPSLTKGEMPQDGTPHSVSIAILLDNKSGTKHFDFPPEEGILCIDGKLIEPTPKEVVGTFHFSSQEIASLAGQASPGSTSGSHDRKSKHGLDLSKLRQSFHYHNEEEIIPSMDVTRAKESRCSWWRYLCVCCCK